MGGGGGMFDRRGPAMGEIGALIWVWSGSNINLVKNPNWWEADQLAIYKRGRGIETREYHVTNPASSPSGNWTGDFGLEVRLPDNSAMLLPIETVFRPGS